MAAEIIKEQTEAMLAKADESSPIGVKMSPARSITSSMGTNRLHRKRSASQLHEGSCNKHEVVPTYEEWGRLISSHNFSLLLLHCVIKDQLRPH